MKNHATQHKAVEVKVDEFLGRIPRGEPDDEKGTWRRMREKLDKHEEMSERNLYGHEKKLARTAYRMSRKIEAEERKVYGRKGAARAFADAAMSRKTDLIFSEEYFCEHIRLRREAAAKGAWLNTEKLCVALFEGEEESAFECLARASPGGETRRPYPGRRIFTGTEYATRLVKKNNKND